MTEAGLQLALSWEQLEYFYSFVFAYRWRLTSDFFPIENRPPFEIIWTLRERWKSLYAQRGVAACLTLSVEEGKALKQLLAVMTQNSQACPPSWAREMSLKHLAICRRLLEQAEHQRTRDERTRDTPADRDETDEKEWV